jgi:hypothetical protein
MVNEGGSTLHVDRNNCGPSLLISLGDHTGGELWQYPGDVLEVHYKATHCNGLLPHQAGQLAEGSGHCHNQGNAPEGLCHQVGPKARELAAVWLACSNPSHPARHGHLRA